MSEYLVPRSSFIPEPGWDPYTEEGANRVITRWADAVYEMLEYMEEIKLKYPAGISFLAQSPLRKKVWVAAAMKTIGLIREIEVQNRGCGLLMTRDGLALLDSIRNPE